MGDDQHRSRGTDPELVHRNRLHLIVAKTIADWRLRQDHFSVSHPVSSAAPRASQASLPGVLAPLPRRKALEAKIAQVPPPQMKAVSFRASRIRAMARLPVWLGMFLRFAFWVVRDKLQGKDTPQQRAIRLRETFEKTGGTFVKVGQHMTMRLDFLPWEYSVELARILDRMPPFPVEQAIATIERATRAPLSATFSQFDPEPIGSSSVGCVYQAVLRTGERVAVKVRRPGIGETFLSDIQVVDWLAGIIEFFTFMRPGHTLPVRRELRETLLGELDFVQEARYQNLFRRSAKKSGKRFFTAPRAYLQYSSEDVFVQEFAAGMWLWELLAAIEQNDADVLALARQLNIDCRKVARRLAWVNYWGWHERIFVYANPHPDNIILGRNGKITFINFTSISLVNRTKRRALQDNMYYAWKQDPLNMARASLLLLEPLPHIDLIEFLKELETYNWQMLYVFASRSSVHTWSERTTALQWLGLIQAARKQDIVIDVDVLRLLRATILFDTLAVRLDRELDIIREFRRFAKFRARFQGRRARQEVVGQLVGGIDRRVYFELERLAKTGEGLFFRLRHMLAVPSANFSTLTGKWSYAVFTLFKLSAQVLVLIGLAAAWVSSMEYLSSGQAPDLARVLRQVISHNAVHVLLLLLVVINGRAVLYRMDDKDV